MGELNDFGAGSRESFRILGYRDWLKVRISMLWPSYFLMMFWVSSSVLKEFIRTKRNIDIICAVEVLDLPDREIEEGHAVTDFDDGLGTNAAHGCTKTTIELENGKLVQETDRFRVGKLVVVNNLVWCRWCNTLPITANYQSKVHIIFGEAYSVFPFALSFKYLRKRAKKLSISVSKS
jgi:hypothetical protein